MHTVCVQFTVHWLCNVYAGSSWPGLPTCRSIRTAVCRTKLDLLRLALAVSTAGLCAPRHGPRASARTATAGLGAGGPGPVGAPLTGAGTGRPGARPARGKKSVIDY